MYPTRKKYEFLLIFILYVSIVIISVIKPPFQSPDEFEHYKRTVSLLNGQLIQTTLSNNGISGVYLSSDHLEFISKYTHLPFKQQNKLDGIWLDGPKISKEAEMLFTPSPGTGPYAPILYGFQGGVNKLLEFLSGDLFLNYKLTSFANITLFFIVMLWVAKSDTVSILPLVIVTSAPLYMFQIGSWSLDSIFFTATIAFIFIMLTNKFWNLLVILATIISTAKISFITTFLPLVFSLKTKQQLFLIILGLLSILFWIVFAVYSNPSFGNFGIKKNFAAFLDDPFTVFWFLVTEIINFSRIKSQLRMSIGHMGWLDYQVNSLLINWFLILFLAFCVICIYSLFLKNMKHKSLLWAAILMWPLVNFIVGVFTTDFSNQRLGLMGIQGRYFYPILIIFSMWIGVYYKKTIDEHHKCLAFICFITVFSSCFLTVQSTLSRYYIQ
jgi:uncharacterized membrane protein